MRAQPVTGRDGEDHAARQFFVGMIMKDRCPQCGFKFGFRGPKTEIERDCKLSRNKVRFFCPNCTIELFYFKSKIERFLFISGYVGTFIGSLNSILRVGLIYTALPKAIEQFFFVLGIVGLGGAILLDFLNQHYKAYYRSQPVNSADIKDHAAD